MIRAASGIAVGASGVILLTGDDTGGSSLEHGPDDQFEYSEPTLRAAITLATVVELAVVVALSA